MKRPECPCRRTRWLTAIPSLLDILVIDHTTNIGFQLSTFESGKEENYRLCVR